MCGERVQCDPSNVHTQVLHHMVRHGTAWYTSTHTHPHMCTHTHAHAHAHTRTSTHTHQYYSTFTHTHPHKMSRCAAWMCTPPGRNKDAYRQENRRRTYIGRKTDVRRESARGARVNKHTPNEGTAERRPRRTWWLIRSRTDTRSTDEKPTCSNSNDTPAASSLPVLGATLPSPSPVVGGSPRNY